MECQAQGFVSGKEGVEDSHTALTALTLLTVCVFTGPKYKDLEGKNHF